MSRIFVLADLQNAYVSMERVFRPKLEGVPTVVLSNKHHSETTMVAPLHGVKRRNRLAC